MKVVVGIPTFKRPQGLARLLDSIALQQVDFDVQVIVADNDSEQQQGVKTVQLYQQSGYPFPLDAHVVFERGISQARNSLMEKAFGEFDADCVAMLDDDEWAEPQWLQELVAIHLQTGAHIVGGHVSPEFDAAVPDWVCGQAIYYQTQDEKSGVVDLIEGTTNVLIAKTVLSDFDGEVFDPFYSLVGGGDKEYFTRLKNKGATFAFAHKARSHEIFSASRLTVKWAKERAYRIGAGDMRIILKNKPPTLLMAQELFKICIAMSVSTVKWLVTFGEPSSRMSAVLLLFRQLGKISALFGKQKSVYRTTHGQ
ncbi:glycosyltransferase family 2 protein [Pseudoalteromonas tunicata]|uniref:glycosyltransferase family 2 protein n=1 Tax=Pseudoalteromonas tunicata TaxID=314281 RepID=UPI00273E58BD|nr:glycosyltransferase family 2 protein [Pseudoalteromonas tunicata]MDP4982464.1 glycosyltransferase [Pseudoalteromonas tunicata]